MQELTKEKKSDDQDALKERNEAKKELKAYREQFEGDWKKYDDAYYGKQHKTGETSKPVKNHIFRIIENEVPILTDSMAGTNLTASQAQKQQAADMLANGIKWVYNDQNLILLLPTLCRSSLLSAPGYLWVSYDPDEEDGEGKIIFKQVPWKSVFLDGNAQTIEQSEKFHIELPQRKRSLARKWPEKKEEIMRIQGESSSSAGVDGGYEKRDIEKETESGKPQEYRGTDIVKYKETWIKSYDLEPVPEEEAQEDLAKEYQELSQMLSPNIKKWEPHDKHEAAHFAQKMEILSQFGIQEDVKAEEIEAMLAPMIEQNPAMSESIKDAILMVQIIDNHREEHKTLKELNPTGERPRYKDNWRVIKSAGDVIFYDGPNPLQDGLIPLVPFYAYKDETIYAFGEIKNILSAQVTLNDMDYREVTGLRRVSNPGWVKDHEAKIEDSQLTNEPGIVVTKPRGTEVRRLEPGQVSPQLEIRKKNDQADMDTIAGQNEQTMNGAMPAGNASGVMVQKIQNQAVGRIRLKDRNIQYYSMKRLGLITASFIKHYWTDEKTLRLRADGFDIQEYYFNPIEIQDLKYAVEISPGSMAGIDKDALNAFYGNLLAQGHITAEEYLSVADIPKKEIILKALEKRNQQAQQMQEMQAQVQQAQAQYEQQIASIQEENIKLKGALDTGRQIGIDLLGPEEKKIFHQQEKQSVINSLAATQANPAVNMEPMTANQNNQGNF
jgi:hypothetical protein